jgi:hypothetical protein
VNYLANLTKLDEAAAAKTAELDLLVASAANLRSFAAAYGVFAGILSIKTGTQVAANYAAIKAALESLPSPSA